MLDTTRCMAKSVTLLDYRRSSLAHSVEDSLRVYKVSGSTSAKESKGLFYHSQLSWLVTAVGCCSSHPSVRFRGGRDAGESSEFPKNSWALQWRALRPLLWKDPVLLKSPCKANHQQRGVEEKAFHSLPPICSTGNGEINLYLTSLPDIEPVTSHVWGEHSVGWP